MKRTTFIKKLSKLIATAQPDWMLQDGKPDEGQIEEYVLIAKGITNLLVSINLIEFPEPAK